MKVCLFCKGDMVAGKTPHVVELENGCILVIKNVPCMKCVQCGETWISGSTTQRLEEIINMMETTLTEIVVVDFAHQVA